MKHITGVCLAVAFSWSIGAAAQGTTATQDTITTTPTDRATTSEAHDRHAGTEAGERTDTARQADARQGAGQTVTAVGCVQRERDVFATRGILNDDVVITNAEITDGHAAFQAAESNRAVGTSGTAAGPYDAERDDLRDEAIVQHDGSRDDERERAASGADRHADHGAGVTGATGTAGTYGGDRDADRDRTTRTEDDADLLTGDDDRHEGTGSAGVAADRPTGAYDPDRDGARNEDGERLTDGRRFQDAHGRIVNLTGDQQQELRGLVGRRVEVKGTVAFVEDAAGTTGLEAQRQAPVGELRGEVRHETPGEGEARATNTGGGWINPDEADAAAGRERLERKPQIEVTSFRDVGECEGPAERP